MRIRKNETRKPKMTRALTCFLLAGAVTASLAFTGCGAAVKTDSTASSSSGSTDATASGTGSTDSNADLAASIADEKVEGSNISDFVKLGEYKGLTLEKTVSSSSASGTSEDTSAILTELSSYTMVFPDDTAIADGMIANIDYVGTIDGTAFDGGTASGYDLTIGSGKFITGFEDQLVGHKKGETVEVKVTFPTTYSKTDLAGKDAVFTVKINKIKSDPWTYVNGKCTVLKYPKDIVDLWQAQVAATYSYYASTYSMDASTYKQAAGITRTDEEQAKINTKSYLVSRAIMNAEGITEDSEDYKTMMNGVLTASGYTSESAATAQGITEEMINITTSYYMAYDLIVKNASVTEVAAADSTAATASAAASAASSSAS